MIRFSNRFHELLVSFYFYKERGCDRSGQLQEIRSNLQKLLLKNHLFGKKGCDKTFVTAPFLGLFITHFIEIASYT